MKNRNRIIGFLISITLTVLIIVIYLLNGFEWLELQSYDLRFSLRGPRPLSDQIVLVTIDEESLQRLSTTLREFKRSNLARAIEHLASAGTRLIGIDMVLSNPSVTSLDDQLRNALVKAGNVVLVRYISSEMAIPPFSSFRETEMGEGLINVALDQDGVLRSMPVLSVEISEGEMNPYLTFSLEMARLLADPEGKHEIDISISDLIRIGSLAVPVPDNKLLINFYGPPGTFPKIPIWRVINGEFSPDQVSGRVVLIGAHNPTSYDAYRTPFSGGVQKVFKPWGGRADLVRLDRMYGVEIHANALQTILDQRFIQRISPGNVIMALVLLGLAATATVLYVERLLWITMTLGSLVLLILTGGIILFIRNRTWIDLVPLAATVTVNYLGGVAYQRYLEAQQRQKITGLFGRYVSSSVVEQLIKNPSLAGLGGMKQRLTILFTDIRGFTSMSEQMDPQDVTRLLNEYCGEMTRLIFKYGGTLDKFMGDAILAFFGNPIPYPDHALRAIKVGLEMQEAVSRLNQKWVKEGKRPIAVGIGINTGVVTVGNMGSEEFVDYTVIGDEVNLACRLEENADGGQILIGQGTYDEVRDYVEVESFESTLFKGKSNLVSVYKVTGLRKCCL